MAGSFSSKKSPLKKTRGINVKNLLFFDVIILN